MQFSDPRKLEVFESLENKFDVSEYERKCSERGLTIRGNELEYAQKVGMLLYAKNKYPDKSALEAYMLLVSGASNADFGSGCSGCGGGQLR
jgi:hypothetical protein